MACSPCCVLFALIPGCSLLVGFTFDVLLSSRTFACSEWVLLAILYCICLFHIYPGTRLFAAGGVEFCLCLVCVCTVSRFV